MQTHDPAYPSLPQVSVPELLFFPDVTPLIIAMSYASYDVVDALLKAGADPLSAAPANAQNAWKHPNTNGNPGKA